jgi:hypothetical protein
MADEKEFPWVTANRDFSNAIIGSRSAKERFRYDVDKDPAGVKKLGFVDVEGSGDKQAEAGAAKTGK